MDLSPAMRAMLRLAFAVLVVALAAGAWELLARQAPGSRYYIGVLPGPIAALRETATIAGLVLLGAAWWVPAASHAGEPRGLVRGMIAGAVVGLGASAYAAARGRYGVQVDDLRPAAWVVFALRHGGLLVLYACLFEFGRRAAFGKRPE
jgi:hypothetical protein